MLPVKPVLTYAQAKEPNAFAVSIFDAWLGMEHYGELDCDADEQRRRNERHNVFCRALRDQYEVFAIRRRGHNTNKRLVLREFSSNEEFLCYIDANEGGRPWRGFFLLAIPALGVIYEQHWDETNIVWCHSASGAVAFRLLAESVGLHALQFRGEGPAQSIK